MSRKIKDEGIYNRRTYLRWHRALLGRNDWVVTDVDAVLYCWTCKRPLALVESSATPNKDVPHLDLMAGMLGIPLFRVDVFEDQVSYPLDVVAEERKIRREHALLRCTAYVAPSLDSQHDQEHS